MLAAGAEAGAAPVPRPAPPPPPQFSGKLLGLASEPGRDEALIDTEGGAPVLVEQGDTIAGWTLARAYPDRVVMKQGTRETTVWFSE